MKKCLMVACLLAVMVGTAMGADDRVSASKKGSLLIYSKVELRWDDTGALIQDTILDITNDANEGVYVQFYFINGDEPLDEVVVGDPPTVIERAHPGWNWVDAQAWLTPNQPMYWSANTGLPFGVQPWPSALDPGDPPGRPDPFVPGERMLRGYVVAWAVNAAGEEIEHNHLKGDAMLVNYANSAAWEYNAYSFTALNVVIDGVLNLDGAEYDYAPSRLLLDFYAVGAELSSGAESVIVTDTDLTLYPVDADLRQEGTPVTTKAKADIWNMNEFRLSGTERCITCWDQTLMANWMNGGAGNNWVLGNLQTNKGKARIDGVAHATCVAADYAILGVAAKVLDFAGETAYAGSTMSLQGTEAATITWDIIDGPEGLNEVFESKDYSVAPQPAFTPAKAAFGARR